MKISEVARRLLDIPWVLSRIRNQFGDARDRLGTGEFGHFYRTVRPYTMCSNARLRGLYRAVKHVVEANIMGDVVECGAARGGSAALMALTLRQMRDLRTLWVFDTFEGLPAPTEDDPDYEFARRHTGSCRGEIELVSGLFERFGCREDTRMVKGLYQDTLPICTVRQVALLHIDCDWYESAMICLEHLYDRVAPGGIIQFDDYGVWEGARRAVDEFRARRNISAPMQRIDYAARQLVKP